jgi:hypothetical protein
MNDEGQAAADAAPPGLVCVGASLECQQVESNFASSVDTIRVAIGCGFTRSRPGEIHGAIPRRYWDWMVVRFVCVVCVPLCVRVSRVSRVCPGSPGVYLPVSARCLFTGTG